jgi:TolB-like protein/Flp pilus assembly protein TadD
MSLFDELKRRNVFRVGIAYVVAAWVLLQLFDVIGEILELPEWGGKLILAMLVLGLFMALIFAWAFELTPEGVKRESEVDRSRSITPQTGRKLNAVIIVLMAVSIAYLLFDKFYLSERLERGTAVTPAPVSAEPAEPAEPEPEAGAADLKSIAVLPFANRSNQADDLFFTDGIHDDLLTQLAKVHELTVISRTSVMEYRDSSKNLRDIGSELNVGTILEGGIQRVGDRVRINAQLIEVSTDRHLWAETFDRELTVENVFELQSEIARKIVEAVAVELSPEEERLLAEVPTQNLAAYEVYLRAKEIFYSANYSRSQEEEARPYLERAIALDPDYAEAHTLLASIYGQLYWRGIDTSEAHLDIYRQTIERAISLKPGSPSALRALANYHYRVENDYQRSLQLLQQALDGAPSNVDLHGDIGLSLRRLGRWEESIASFRRALELDPANAFYYALMLETMSTSFQWQDVIDHSVSLEDADPDDLDTQVNRALAQFNLNGDLRPLERVFETMNPVASSNYFSYSAYVHWLQRDLDAMLRVLDNPLWQNEADQQEFRITRHMQLADAWRLKGNEQRAKRHYQEVVDELDEVMVSALQVQAYSGMNVAVAMARLGRHDEALALADRLVHDIPPERDAMLWGSLHMRRAMVRGLAGDEEGAIEDLELALRTPTAFPVTVWNLHYDPNWDYMRNNSRFEELATPPNLIRTRGP